MGMQTPGEYGGWVRCDVYARIMQELATLTFGAVLLGHSIDRHEGFAAVRTEQQKSKYLPRLATGNTLRRLRSPKPRWQRCARHEGHGRTER